jgi:7-carboxy-7-deazaguanine synthase
LWNGVDYYHFTGGTPLFKSVGGSAALCFRDSLPLFRVSSFRVFVILFYDARIMSYAVKEIFYTLQGEGFHAGRAAVFCRFAGCNLWSGQEEDRATAICNFCDTDFVGTDGPGGGKFVSASELADAVRRAWPSTSAGRPFVVCTGGEPLLQMDTALVEALHRAGFEIAIETNGTRLPPERIDWICVSPKAGSELLLRRGDELKLIYPQEGADPQQFEHLNFRYLFLQPMDGPQRERNTQLAIEYCLQHPKWRLSLQRHKIWGIP